ncbi:EF-hand domain-containing protein [Microcoleus sp. A2-C5]
MDRDRSGTIDFAEFGELILHCGLLSGYTELVSYVLPIDVDDRHFRQ